MNDGRFSAAMIESNTQIFMMDEWTPDSLSCEDAKRVLQGGMNFVPQKHKNGWRINYNSGFFITTNEYPDFGNQTDCDAIRKRLEVFQTSSLKRRDTSVSGWLRMNCMEVFHYLADYLRDEPIFDAPSHLQPNAVQTGAIYNDFDFNPMSLMYRDEMDRFCLSQPPSAGTNAATNENVDDEDEANNDDNTALVQALDHAIIQADRKGPPVGNANFFSVHRRNKYPDFDPEAEQEPSTQKPLTQQEARASSASEESFSEITSYQPPRPELVPEAKTPTRTPPSSPKLVILESPIIPKPSTDSESSINNDVFDEPPAVTSSAPNKATKRRSLSLKRCTSTIFDQSHQLVTLTSDEEE
ncbi:uncharacterized protein [Clytia hemisphaerica]|uniref:uncharacterized protein n=1 Tax=Clytia hemisphaerica TaxID=252671 RepID=UPI0034D5BCB3